MAARIVFRDPETGRFISAAQAAEIGGIVEQYGDGGGPPIIADYFDWAEGQEAGDDEPGPNQWSIIETERGWLAAPGEDKEDIFGLTPPEGATAFRVFVEVEGSSEYPRGWASTGWHGVSSWPPSLDMVRGVDATGYALIRFSR